MTRVASIGECMIELSEAAGGLLSRSYGGDTLNTAIYLARLGVAVDYVTALGDDPWSEEMVSGWQAEGIGTGRVLRLQGRLPGLYLISTDKAGQRRFYYWRDSSPARQLFELPQTLEISAALAEYDLIYVSGISLSLYGEAGRKRLYDAFDATRARGHRVAFDTNFRPRLWPDPTLAKAAYRNAIKRADLVLASCEDLRLLFGEDGLSELPISKTRDRGRAQARRAGGAYFPWDGKEEIVPAEPVPNVVDTTAAGDSFAAAYLAARLAGAEPPAGSGSGHRLAGVVVQHRGAIIPYSAMPAEMLPASGHGEEQRS